MEWNWTVNTHDKYGDVTEEGIFLQFNDTASVRFDDPTDLIRFAESVLSSMDEIVAEWNNSVVDE